MLLFAIKTDKGVAISPQSRDQKPQAYRYDGQRGEPTHHDRWLMLPAIPTTVEQIKVAHTVTTGYKLRDGVAVSEATPAELPSDAFHYWDNEGPWDAVRGVYDPVTEDVPETYEAIEFSVTTLAEIKDFDAYTNFSFDAGKVYSSYSDQMVDTRVTDQSVEYQLADKVFFHPEVLPLRPSRLSSEDSYKIIREHIKQNIDGKRARITSDYDFCLTVAKVIRLAEPYEYTTESGTGKRKRVERKLCSNREVVVYKVAPDRGRDGVYSGYPRCPEFVGANHADLVANIKARLDELIAEINAPVVDCPHCKGVGVVQE